jgi:DNA-directed RNA polymerase subunit RPC12/RpoP
MKILAVCGGCKTQYDLTGWQTGDSVRCRCGTLVVVPEPRRQDARLVRCASCGAVRNKEGASNCAFCGALFSTVDKGWGSMCPGLLLPPPQRCAVLRGMRIENLSS